VNTTGTTTLSANPTASELAALYANSGATTTTTTTTEQGDQTTYNPIDYGNGTYLWEKPGDIIGYQGQGQDATPITGAASLGGYSKKDGDFLNYYDVNGKLVAREKWNKGDWLYCTATSLSCWIEGLIFYNIPRLRQRF
jgi:hypothetical protein